MTVSAGQISSRTSNNDAYSRAGAGTGAVPFETDGLNRMTKLGGTTLLYDARGNMVSDGSRGFGYDAENRLNSLTPPGSGPLPVVYDPLGRYYEGNGG